MNSLAFISLAIRFSVRIFLGVFLVFSFPYAFANAQCSARAELAGQMAVTKYAVIEKLREKPTAGPTGEAWRLMGLIHNDEYTKLGDSTDQVMHTARLMEKTHLSEDWRIELLIFRELFAALCEAKMDVMAVHSVNARALENCFGGAPPGRPDFPACIRAEVNVMRDIARAK